VEEVLFGPLLTIADKEKSNVQGEKKFNGSKEEKENI
jgi:hypothetical protein